MLPPDTAFLGLLEAQNTLKMASEPIMILFWLLLFACCIFLITVFTADLHFTPTLIICQLLAIFVAIYIWSIRVIMVKILKNGHNRHYGPSQYGRIYVQNLLDIENLARV